MPSVICGTPKTSYTKKEYKSGAGFFTSVTTTDARGNKSETVTDESGNTRSVKDFYEKDGKDSSIYTEYSYDAQGRCTKEQEARGNYKTYSYDKKGYIREEDFYDETGSLSSKARYTYDARGNAVKQLDYDVKDGKEVLKESAFYTYDRQGRVKTSYTSQDETEPSADAVKENCTTYAYDRKGNIKEIDYGFRKEGVRALKYSYDSDGKVVKITADKGLISITLREYRYDTYGRIAEIEDHYGFRGPDDVMLRKYTYDELGRLKAAAHVDSKDGKVKEAWLYDYSKNGNIIREEAVSAYTGGDGLTQKVREYTYDKNGRLTKAVTCEGEDPSEEDISTSRYEYDAAGNRTKEIRDGEETEYTFNGLDELTSEETVSGGEIVSSKTYEYDRNGNRVKETDSITDQIISMQYNETDMMGSYEKKENGEITLRQKNTYNSSGQRIRKEEERTEEKPAVGGDEETEAETELVKETTRYFYDGESLLRTTEAGGKEKSFNLLTPSGNLISSVKTDEDNNEGIYLYNRDEQGSTSSILDEEGEAAAVYEYDEYGNTETIAGEDFDNEICYTSQILDKSTGLYYYNARFYDSGTGTFTSQDTYRGEAANPLTQNLYTYCAGDPVNRIDPSGHSWLRKPWGKAKKFAKRAYRGGKKIVRTGKRGVRRTAKNVRKAARKTYRKAKIKAKKAKKHAASKIKKAKVQAKAFKGKIKNKAKEHKGQLVTVLGVAGMNLGYGLMLSGDPMKARAGGEIVKFFNYARNDLYDNDKMVPATLRDVNGSVWKAEDATCHQFSAKKFLDSVKRQSSHYEVIYGENGNRVTDPRDKGTANYIPRDLSRGKVSLTSAFPFSSSAPIFTIATLGLFTPSIFSI